MSYFPVTIWKIVVFVEFFLFFFLNEETFYEDWIIILDEK